MKNFLEAKFQLFCQKNLQTCFSKYRQKSPKIFFQSAFWLKCEKNLASAPAVAGKNTNSGLEIYEMS